MSLALLAMAIFTLCILLWRRIKKIIIIKKKGLTIVKTTAYKNNKLTSYMF